MAIDNIKKFVVFDFFSGIGGFHLALNQILNIKIKEVFPFDVNIIANDVYNHNFSINHCLTCKADNQTTSSCSYLLNLHFLERSCRSVRILTPCD